MEENINNVLNFFDDLLTIDEKDKNIILNDNSLKLAYIGDVIFELYIRNFIITKYKNKLKINDIHKKVIKIVCAKAQADIISYLIKNDILSDEEVHIYKHARNTKTNSKSRSSSIIDYKKATGFEALIGFLFYTNKFSRINELLKISLDSNIVTI